MAERRRLGETDVTLPRVGVGCRGFGSRVDARQATRIVDAALDRGVAFFDTADAYGLGASEECLGRAIAGRREQVVVATKFGMSMNGRNGPEHARASKRYLRRALAASLRRLGTDYLDLYQLHTPDRVTPLPETIAAMAELVDEGWVRAIGSSNLTADEVATADDIAAMRGSRRFVTVQDEYSLYNRSAEAELVPTCRRRDIGLLPYFPLASGRLGAGTKPARSAYDGHPAASPAHDLAETDRAVLERLEAFARARSITPATLAIGYLAAQPEVVSVIAGASGPEQVVANSTALAWTPTAADLRELAAMPHTAASYTTFATRPRSR